MHLFLKHSIYILLLFLSLTGCKEKQSFTPVSGGTVNANQIIEKINKGQYIQYTGVTIKGDLDFTRVNKKYIESIATQRIEIDVPVTFSECIFEGKVIAARKDENKFQNFVYFNKNATFLKSTFKDSVKFTESIFTGMTNFSQSIFEKNTDYQGAVFQHKTNYFTQCVFKQYALFQRSVFKGESNFFKAVFEDRVNFQYATFYNDIQLSNSLMKKNFDFSLCKVIGNSFFHYSNFKGLANFTASKFFGSVEFREANFSKELNATDIIFYDSCVLHKTTFNNKADFSNAVFIVNSPFKQPFETQDSTQLILNNVRFPGFKSNK